MGAFENIVGPVFFRFREMYSALREAFELLVARHLLPILNDQQVVITESELADIERPVVGLAECESVPNVVCTPFAFRVDTRRFDGGSTVRSVSVRTTDCTSFIIEFENRITERLISDDLICRGLVDSAGRECWRRRYRIE